MVLGFGLTLMLSLNEKLFLVIQDGPVTFAEILHRIRERWGMATERSVERALEGERFRRLPGDQYVLAEHVEAQSEATPPPSAVSLTHLPELDRPFVVVDVETTGTNPEEDRVFQVAGVRFSDGRPDQVFNFYLSPAPREIPDTLRRRLGISGNPEIERLIAEAPAAESVLPALHRELDGLPWVAHNARFDAAFLEGLGLHAPFCVDTLELAGLVLPTAPSLSEPEVAAALGIDPATVSFHPLIAPALRHFEGPQVHGTFHNALTDVLVLSLVFMELRRRLPPPLLQALERRHRGDAPWSDEELEAFLASLGADAHVPAIGLVSRLPLDPLAALHRYLEQQGRAPREAQDQMLRLIREALTAGESCACEAPTGTGKTLAYLFPVLEQAFAQAGKVCLCTATRNLQDQLAEEFERLDRLGTVPFRWAVIKGSGNYLCLAHLRRRLRELIRAGAAASPEEFYAGLYWLAFAAASEDGLLDEGAPALRRRFPALEAWREEIQATTGCVSQDGSGAHRRCHRASVYSRAEGADVVVMNHTLWLAGRGGMEGLRAVVADEAHELEAVATSFLEDEVSGSDLQGTFRRLVDLRSGTGLLVIAAALTDREAVGGALAIARRTQRAELPALGRAFRELLRRLRLAEDPRYGAQLQITPFPQRTLGHAWRAVRRAWRELADLQMRPLAEHLRALAEDERLAGPAGRALAGVLTRLEDQLRAAEEALNPRNRRFIHILSLGPASGDDAADSLAWTLKSTPVDVAPTLRAAYEDLPAVFVSATLDTGQSEGGAGGMAYALDRVGLGMVPAHRRHVLPPVLPYRTHAAFAIARAMVHAPLSHTARSFAAELTEAYTRLLRLTHGKALLLFTARTRLLVVGEPLRDRLAGIPVILQGDDLPNRLLQRFRDDRDSVLAGLKQFWQGVDVPGEALSLVFIDKLPFPLFTDPLVQARAALVERRGGNAFEEYLLPGMLIALKQGFGRLIRDQADRGAVVLFDRRAATKAYLRRLEACLPGFVPRNPQAERTWPGLLAHLRGVIPSLFPPTEGEEALPDSLPSLSTSCPELPLPLRDPTEAEEGIRAALAAFGFEAFRSAEQRVLTELQLAHRDVLGLMPTGSGKSLTFQLAAMTGPGLTLVISPLIALMRDQVEGLLARGWENVAALYSGQSADERSDALRRARLGRLKLLYVAPERLRDPVLLEVLQRTHVRALVVDEAHCVYSWGPHFRPEFLYIREVFRHIGRVPVAALTATAPPERRREILEALGLDPDHTEQVVASFARPELRFMVYGPRSEFNRIRGPRDKLRTLLKLLAAARRDGDAAIIYVNTTAGADLLASQLRLSGFEARAYHGRMTTQERHTVQDLFMDDHIRMVVCTKAFGMGVDKAGVRYVIHYDAPGDLVAYAQEAGRAGRGLSTGEEAYCVLLYHPGDGWIHERFAEDRMPDEDLLASVAADIRAHAGEHNHPLYDRQEALERLSGEVDEIDETRLNVALHRLESLGFIRRGVDVVTECLAYQDEGGDPDDRQDEVPRRILRALPAQRPDGTSEPLDLILLASQIGLTPAELSGALARLAVDGEIIYIPFRRAASLDPCAPLLRGERPCIDTTERERLRREAAAGWHETRRYAELAQGCRAVALLQHLGEPDEPQPCGTCDLCAPCRWRPWGDIADEDVPRPIDHVEAAGLLLEAVQWNLERPEAGEGRVMGEGTLWATLTANDYYLSRHRSVEWLRRTPFYGVFRSFPNRMDGLRRLFRRLVELEYARLSEATFEGNGETVSYTYPDLTERGRETIQTGAYVDLEEGGQE